MVGLQIHKPAPGRGTRFPTIHRRRARGARVNRPDQPNRIGPAGCRSLACALLLNPSDEGDDVTTTYDIEGVGAPLEAYAGLVAHHTRTTLFCPAVLQLMDSGSHRRTLNGYFAPRFFGSRHACGTSSGNTYGCVPRDHAPGRAETLEEQSVRDGGCSRSREAHPCSIELFCRAHDGGVREQDPIRA
jgi:hypothetical protein